MGTITLSVPDKLKKKMDKKDIINWSAVARHAFIRTLGDLEELDLNNKVRMISEIAEDDKRVVKEPVVKEVIRSIEAASEDYRSGKRRPMTLDKLDKLMGLK